MNIKEIISEGLKAHGFGGLCNTDGECCCDIDDLAPCGESCDVLDCQGAYKVEDRCKTCKSHCDGYDPDGPGICYTLKKPKKATTL